MAEPSPDDSIEARLVAQNDEWRAVAAGVQGRTRHLRRELEDLVERGVVEASALLARLDGVLGRRLRRAVTEGPALGGLPSRTRAAAILSLAAEAVDACTRLAALERELAELRSRLRQ